MIMRQIIVVATQLTMFPAGLKPDELRRSAVGDTMANGNKAVVDIRLRPVLTLGRFECTPRCHIRATPCYVT